MASLGLHLPFEITQVHIKILNKFVGLFFFFFSCYSVLCQFQSLASHKRKQEEVGLLCVNKPTIPCTFPEESAPTLISLVLPGPGTQLSPHYLPSLSCRGHHTFLFLG